MLTEHFIASIGVPTKPPGTNTIKDAAIFIHEFQPLLAQRHIFKKSATPPNCLAVSATHIFAAQAEKAVVHVYSREKSNQEATVPFTERITCISLACDETVLVLGTAEGRIFLWELASGRQISTTQAHLQALTVLAVDPAGNFLLSASADSTVHVWSIPALLSFTNSGAQPLSSILTFTSHRAEVSALVLGHSSGFCNFAVSASKDKTLFVWDYHSNTVLRTYLLPAVPTCLALDGADRAVYVGYEDGSVQVLDLYAPENGKIGNVQNGKTSAPIQPPKSSRWRPPDNSAGAASSLTISFDGCTILSGHESGVITSWDVAKNGLATSLLQAPLPGPVTNLFFLPVTGFLNEQQRRIKVPMVMKPKFGAFDNSLTGTVPGNYTLNVEFTSDLPKARPSRFEEALTAPSFSTEMLDEGLTELFSWNKREPNAAREEDEDFMALDDGTTKPKQLTLEEQNAALKTELEALRRVQSASFDEIEKINQERRALLEREQKRLRRVGVNGDVAAADVVEGMEYSSSSED